MSWTELPPDFRLEDVSQLTSRLSIRDAYTLRVIGQKVRNVVLLDDRVLESAVTHVAGSEVESGGLLVGKTYLSNSAFATSLRHVVVILKSVAADEATGRRVSLRMEPRLWTKTNSEKAPDQFVVGWYHSHPNLGAFFSGTDRLTQSRFFPEPHKVGWVIDPVRKEDAWFIGGASEQLPSTCIVVGGLNRLA